MKTKEEIFFILDELKIPYEVQEHKAIFSEKDAAEIKIDLNGIDVKNLFVKDKKGKYALVTLALHKRADLKKIAALLNMERLSFCNSEELMKYLKITPGSVTPLCLMHPESKDLLLVFDENLKGQNVIVHPLRNTASVSISFSDLCTFARHFGHSWIEGDVYKED